MACSGCPGRHRFKISNILKVALLSAQRLLGKVFLTCRKFWSEFSRNLEIQTLNVPSITRRTIIRRCVGLIWDLASKSKLKHLLPSQESFYLKKSWFGLKPEKEDFKAKPCPILCHSDQVRFFQSLILCKQFFVSVTVRISNWRGLTSPQIKAACIH